MSEFNDTLKEELNSIKLQIQKEADYKFALIFLDKRNLKIGDEVMCRFHYSHGTSKQSYLTSGTYTGIIKEENGVVFVESKDKLPEAYSNSNGRSYRSWWEYRNIYKRKELTDIQFDNPEPIKP